MINRSNLDSGRTSCSGPAGDVAVVVAVVVAAAVAEAYMRTRCALDRESGVEIDHSPYHP